MEKWSLVYIAAASLLLLIGPVGCNSTVCAYVQRGVVKEMPHKTDEEGDKGIRSSSSSKPTSSPEVLPDNQTIQCTKATDKCYALWSEDPHNKSTIVILAQGCWESSGKCDSAECVTDGRPSKAMNNTKFCCCTGDMCNVNIHESDTPLATEEPLLDEITPSDVEEKNYGKETVIISFASVISVIVVIAAVCVTYRRWLSIRKPSPDSMHLMEAPPPLPSPTLDLENLKLIEIVGRGRYGSVWRGTLCDAEVAVKVFMHPHRQYYLNERDIYTLPFMDHPSLMKFIGADERLAGPDGTTLEYYIVMAHAQLGCLQDYLRHNSVDWMALCRMTRSIAKGLAHLHTDIRKGESTNHPPLDIFEEGHGPSLDKVKPCISHRDVNSRNVLVRTDLSCALCDMGFAMKIAGSKYYNQSGEEQHAETTSLTDVGTLRYMAPEVLEGAVNLRDCESSLKQIDVYALGLVIWEVATRCSDLYQGLELPQYKLPFEAEIGLHPTFEQMQVLVSRHKARPLFPDVWKDTNMAVRLLKETIEDCWDQDAEARLTSLCVEERLQELTVLWERHKVSIGVSGVSPTVNPTFPQTSCSRQTSSGGYGSTTTMTTGSSLTDTSSGGELTDRNANIMGIVSLADATAAAGVLSGRTSGGGGCNYQRLNQNRESSVSEMTVETTVTTSPSDPAEAQPPPLGKNVINNQMFPWSSVPLQPHQGRNPCLERNMIMEPLEEVSISGNTLLEKGCANKGLAYHMDPTPDMLFDALHLVDSMESNSLVNHDVLGQSARNCHPIPYVQNAVHGTLPVCPKQPNVPGNGTSKSAHHKRGAFAGRFERKDGARRLKDWGGIRSLLDWTRLTRSGSGEEEDKSVRPSSDDTSDARRATSDGAHHREKSNLSHQRQQPPASLQHKVQTQVCLLTNGTAANGGSGQTVVRLAANGHVPNGCYASAELGVAKLQLPNGHAPVVKTRMAAAVPPTDVTAECSSTHPRPTRPNTLSLKGHDFHRPRSSNGEAEGGCRDHADSAPSTHRKTNKCARGKGGKRDAEGGTRQKIEQRVKTPFQLKPGRFSLYDDRMMMSSWQPGSEPSGGQVNKSKFSLSVPIDINSVCAAQADDFLQKYNTRAGLSQPQVRGAASPALHSTSTNSTSAPPPNANSVHKLSLPSFASPNNSSSSASGNIQGRLNNHSSTVYQVSCI